MKVVLSHEREQALDACHLISVAIYRLAMRLADEVANKNKLEQFWDELDAMNKQLAVIDEALR